MTSGDTKLGLSAMEGSGFYNRNSAMQAAGIALLLPFWEAACRTVAIDNGTLVIVDYASSQGHNSMAPMRIAIEELRARAGAGAPVEVIHTDLPSNDFSSLFKALQEDPDSYMRGASGIFPAAIGRSYFEALFPPGRVHLGWNTWSMQWMSRSPAQAPDHILAGLSGSNHVSAAVKQQQAIDWRRFLKVRSSEMRPGAKFLCAFTGSTADETGWEWLLGELWAAVLDLGHAGLLSEDEQCRITIPIGLRTLDDIRAPFVESGRFADLVLEHTEMLKVSDVIWDDFLQSGDRPAAVLRSLRQLDVPLHSALASPGEPAALPQPLRDQAAVGDGLGARSCRKAIG